LRVANVSCKMISPKSAARNLITPDELLKTIVKHEDNFAERKPGSVATSELRQIVSAYANTVPEDRVAVDFVGVHDETGAALGVGNPDQLQKRIREVCRGDCYPPIDYTSEVQLVNDKPTVAVVIPPSKDKPHFTGPAYVRRRLSVSPGTHTHAGPRRPANFIIRAFASYFLNTQ
jgi:predicted HTH transcriptional regulator